MNPTPFQIAVGRGVLTAVTAFIVIGGGNYLISNDPRHAVAVGLIAAALALASRAGVEGTIDTIRASSGGK